MMKPDQMVLSRWIMRRANRTRLLAAAVLGCLVTGPAGAQDPPLLAPESGPFDVGTGFSLSNKVRRSISGIACPADTAATPFCLVVFDEEGQARHLRMANGIVEPDQEPVVLLGAGELDAEGAATDGTAYFVTGSHSAKRSDCASNPDSRHVFRIEIDPTTGKVRRDADGNLAELQDTERLWSIMGSIPELKDFVGEQKCLGTEPPEKAPQLKGQRGLNIEGLAAKGGRLYFGMRGPAESGAAKVLEIAANELFSGSDAAVTENGAKPVVHTIKVGDGRGIRDLQAVKDGFLILAGPDDDDNESVGWVVAFWDGVAKGEDVAELKSLAQLDLQGVERDDCDKEVKPEAMAVLGEDAGHYRILILSDGMCDGGPLTFNIPR